LLGAALTWYNQGMSDQPKDQLDEQTDDQEQVEGPDGRGPRPTDPNELAKWIVDQTTGANENSKDDS